MSMNEIKQIIESLIFVSNEPLNAKDIQNALDDFPPEEVQAALDALAADFDAGTRGLVLGQAGGGYQLLTAPMADPWIRKFLRARSQNRLTMAALETLAIIAYKQPITLPEILALRKVNSTGVIKTLLDRNLIRIVGRKKVVGNPILYGTTKDFLLRFGLNSLKELPSLEEFQSLVEAAEGEILPDAVDEAPQREAAMEGESPVVVEENGNGQVEGQPEQDDEKVEVG